MATRIVQAEGLPESILAEALDQGVAWLLDWRSERRNALFDYASLPLVGNPRLYLAHDLLDIAAAVYLADLATVRGRNEDWVRDLELVLPVRRLDFWRQNEAALAWLLQRLTGDNFRFEFYPRAEEAEPPPGADPWIEADSVCLLSGGLDSLAGAVMLLRTEHHPRLVMHRSGNPRVAQAQDQVVATLQDKWPDQFRLSSVRLAPSSRRTGAWPFPPPEQRESSRRTRSFLFMALGAVAAAGGEVGEVYLYDNAVLTSGVPLSEARSGSFTTHSTHPVVLAEFNQLLERAGWPQQVLNPFLYQAKGEIIRTCLGPVLSPQEIEQTVSCWAVGRQQRQCGGCVPCLLRRVSLLAADLPDEVYEMDLLGSPAKYVGTEAYRNLVDLLGWATRVLSTPEQHLPLQYPSLLEIQEGGAQLMDVVRALRRQATEIFQVAHERFPEADRLMGELT